MLLLLDNFDSFTYNLVDYFEQIGAKCEVVRNDQTMEFITSKKYDGVVLSPGPENPDNAGVLMKVLEYYHDKTPVLGICLGHQAIGQFFGCHVKKAIKPMHGKISSIKCKEDLLFEGIPMKYNVVRYHSLVVSNPTEKDPIEIIAATEEKEIMAFRHKILPIRSVQFHPEAVLTEYGLELLKNWYEKLVNKKH